MQRADDFYILRRKPIPVRFQRKEFFSLTNSSFDLGI